MTDDWMNRINVSVLGAAPSPERSEGRVRPGLTKHSSWLRLALANLPNLFGFFSISTPFPLIAKEGFHVVLLVAVWR